MMISAGIMPPRVFVAAPRHLQLIRINVQAIATF
jgi:hypothetical protein